MPLSKRRQQMRMAEDALWEAYAANRSTENRNALVNFHRGAMHHVSIVYLSKYNLVAKRSLDEVLSDAAVIMIRCVELFDRRRGFRFTTYYYNSFYMSVVQGLKRMDRGAIPTISPKDSDKGHDNSDWVFGGRNNEEFNFEHEAGATFDKLLSCLSDREQQIIRLRYLEFATLEAIAKKFGITKERVRQVTKASLVKLREEIGLKPKSPRLKRKSQ